MWKLMFSGFWAIVILALSPSTSTEFAVGPHTVLVYRNLAGQQEAQFVIRLARYQPDILLEWETLNHQGTLHLERGAVESTRKFTLTQLFEIGVDVESPDVMTVWLSRKIYDDLVNDGKAKIELNNLPVRLEVSGEGTYQLMVNKEPREIPVIQVKDSRHATWMVHKNPDNPILVKYVSPYFDHALQTVATGDRNSLRWIKP